MGHKSRKRRRSRSRSRRRSSDRLVQELVDRIEKLERVANKPSGGDRSPRDSAPNGNPRSSTTAHVSRRSSAVAHTSGRLTGASKDYLDRKVLSRNKRDRSSRGSAPIRNLKGLAHVRSPRSSTPDRSLRGSTYNSKDLAPVHSSRSSTPDRSLRGSTPDRNTKVLKPDGKSGNKVRNLKNSVIDSGDFYQTTSRDSSPSASPRQSTYRGFRSPSRTSYRENNNRCLLDDIPDSDSTRPTDTSIMLDEETLRCLGRDPGENEKKDTQFHAELASSWSKILQNGLDQDMKAPLIAKYPIPSNCTTLSAPTINLEIKKLLSQSQLTIPGTICTRSYSWLNFPVDIL